MTNEAFLKRKDLARILQVSEMTIKRWEADGLPFMQLSHQTKYYDLAQVKAWMNQPKEEQK